MRRGGGVGRAAAEALTTCCEMFGCICPTRPTGVPAGWPAAGTRVGLRPAAPPPGDVQRASAVAAMRTTGSELARSEPPLPPTVPPPPPLSSRAGSRGGRAAAASLAYDCRGASQ